MIVTGAIAFLIKAHMAASPTTERSILFRKLLRGTMVLTLGRSASYGLSFIRNIILARMLAKADYGLAAVFGLAISIVEVRGRMGFGTLIVQAKQGDDPDFQGTVHAIQFIGGLCSALLLASTSVPMARLFKMPQTWWAFALLAVVPLCYSVAHLDVWRRQRDLNYLPLMLAEIVPQALNTAAVWPLVRWFGDYRAIVWLMIGKAVFDTTMTFTLARRPYHWTWDPRCVRGILLFSWPLLLTGFVMFGCQQLDQMIVGAKFSLSVLANYALAYSLVNVPWYISSQVAGSLMLPLLARVQDNPDQFRRQYRVCTQASAIAGVIITLPLMVAGEQVITLLYGAKYHGTGPFVALLDAAIAIRFLRLVSSIAAAAKADTINEFHSYIGRSVSLPLALTIVVAGGTPLQIAGCALIGEIVAACVSIARLRRRQSVPLRESFDSSVYLLTLVAVGLGFALVGGPHLRIWSAAIAAIGAFTIALGAARFMFPEVARSVIAMIRLNLVAGTEQPART